ncbi:hypothetical protein VNO78_23277 [Psophocarpus tetragonolobus]|uniref:Ionotropic glutamate receptor C-terminal domain-containing protein n=1 Tax=Psophocarpus tetragonolobus TaxID=3891 RepID=A0AAN9S3Q6_PSOTE
MIKILANIDYTMAKCLYWFLIILLVLQQTQKGNGSNATKVIKLRVGVPHKNGFPQFVNVVWNSHEKKYHVSGYCIDVFNAVVKLLPFNVSLDIKPYVVESRHSSGAGSYDSLLQQIPTKLRPSFLNVNDLRNGGYYVGYQTGSFIYDVLVEQFKFDRSKLRNYSSSSEYQHALNIGSQRGGVAAIFDELPYLKVFLQQFGSNYILAGPRYRNDGFGFAFPLNSNLTSHFSRAILNVTESDLMNKIEETYFGKNDIGEEASATIPSATLSLNFHSFAGLFLITGVSTLLVLLVSETVIWQRLILKAKALLPHSTSHPNTPIHPTHDSTRGIEAV